VNNKLAMICGVFGALWLLAMVLIAGAAFEGYDHSAQYISELGAAGAPHGWQVSWLGFLPVGVLICAFAWFALRSAPRSVLAALGFIGVFCLRSDMSDQLSFPATLAADRKRRVSHR